MSDAELLSLVEQNEMSLKLEEALSRNINLADKVMRLSAENAELKSELSILRARTVDLGGMVLSR